MPRSKVKDGFNRRWFMHPQWKKANVMCINACGVGLYDAWDYTRGCYTDGSWMSPSKIAKVIIDVVIKDAELDELLINDDGRAFTYEEVTA